jgi:gamma-glutamylaminecyclotransferase
MCILQWLNLLNGIIKTNNMHKVFVYGSLLKGCGNHSLLGDSRLLGVTRTPKGFDMFDLGVFPGTIPGLGTVTGEVYEVSDETLRRLDRLEGYNSTAPDSGLYNRIEIDTEFGKSYIYIYNNTYGRKMNPVENGDWRTHYTKKFNK